MSPCATGFAVLAACALGVAVLGVAVLAGRSSAGPAAACRGRSASHCSRPHRLWLRARWPRSGYCNHRAGPDHRAGRPARPGARPPSTSTGARGSRAITTAAASSSTPSARPSSATGSWWSAIDYRLGPHRAVAGPDRGRQVRHPLPARQRTPARHRSRRDRGLGPERRAGTSWRCSAPPARRPAGTSAPTRGVSSRRAGGGRHGRAERPPHHGGPG